MSAQEGKASIFGDWKTSLALGLAGIAIGGGAVALALADDAGSSSRAEVEQIVREYILANPEIIPEAAELLQARQLAQVIDDNRAAFETPFGGAWAGAEDGDVVLVEFFDYACGFCRKTNADIDRLLAEDRNLKVVWRDLPVLGPDSQAAAEASLAAARQGRFRPFYDRLFAEGRPTPEAVARARQAVGVSPPASPEFQAELEKNFQLANAVQANGTPMFVVGDKVLRGAVGYEALKQAVAEARAQS